MCNIQPLYGYVVTEDRLDKAVTAIRAARTKMTTAQAIEVITEIGYGDAILWDNNDSLQLSLSDLQLVVTAAALAAVAEAGCRQEYKD